MRRKLTAIVAADIFGYSKRLSEDESGTLAGIEDLRTQIIEPHLAKHSGRIFRLLGDSTLLEFDSALGRRICHPGSAMARASTSPSAWKRLPSLAEFASPTAFTGRSGNG